LHTAAHGGHETVLRLLIEHQAEVSAQDIAGATALHCSAYFRHETVTRLLLEDGAEVSAKTNNGWTALHFAARGGSEALTVLLLDKGADEQAQTNAGNTPKHFAEAGLHHQVGAILQAVGVRRAKCVAFAMGHHERVGVGSRVKELDQKVLRMVLERV
jgi:ankyrin repeat protein